MKIKNVCEATELSDRTIRYYIEEELISPSYTENYLGRRTYDFCEKDIEELNQISVLRKFDFTIEEIKCLVHQTEASSRIIKTVIERTEELIGDKGKKLSLLSQINCHKEYSVSELVEELNKISSGLPKPKEKIEYNIPKIIFKILKTTLRAIIVWLPFVTAVLSLFIKLRGCYYPVFEPKWALMALATLLPSIGVLSLSKAKFKWKKMIISILLVFCILLIPYNCLFSAWSVWGSTTTDIKNYRKFDADCNINRDILFQKLFPTYAPHSAKQSDGSYKNVLQERKYYYSYAGNSSCYEYTVYVEFPCDYDKLDEEKSRVAELFEDSCNNEAYNYNFTPVKKGSYNCLILYNGDEPFKEATKNYYYLIFAYNDNDKTVRYIHSFGYDIHGDIVNQPYYLQLDW